MYNSVEALTNRSDLMMSTTASSLRCYGWLLQVWTKKQEVKSIKWSFKQIFFFSFPLAILSFLYFQIISVHRLMVTELPVTRTPNQPSQYLMSLPPCSKEMKRIPGPYSENVYFIWVLRREKKNQSYIIFCNILRKSSLIIAPSVLSALLKYLLPGAVILLRVKNHQLRFELLYDLVVVI